MKVGKMIRGKSGMFHEPNPATVGEKVAVMPWDEWEIFKRSYLALLELHKEECDEKNCTVIIHAESLVKEATDG